MSSSMRFVRQALAARGRGLVAGIVAVGVLAGPVAAAGAAGETLTLTKLPGPAPGSTVAAKATGTASAGSVLFVYHERDGVDCAATAWGHRFRPTVGPLGADPENPDPSATVTAGPYDVLIRWAPLPAGTYRLCAYLYGTLQGPDDPPLAVATTVMTSIEDNDADGVPDGTDACPGVSGTGPDGCAPPVAVVPPAPTPPTGPVALPAPKAPGAPASPVSDPTGVTKLKPSKGTTTACGAGCVARTRTVGPFSFALKVRVAGDTTTATGSVTLARGSAQAGTSGRVCLGGLAGASKRTCRVVTWKVGRKVTLTRSITTPSRISRSARAGFGLSAQVGALPVGGGVAISLKQAGRRVVPDAVKAARVSSRAAATPCARARPTRTARARWTAPAPARAR